MERLFEQQVVRSADSQTDAIVRQIAAQLKEIFRPLIERANPKTRSAGTDE